ncbi:MAG: toxin-antitoxin system HicB family antitoxin [Opitutaceae bacterium]|jgi:predicted HicB family RNase H-like nuclease
MKTESQKTKTARYLKIVEWSKEDKCFVGKCPGLFLGGCHGDDETAVYKELCELVEGTIRTYETKGWPLPNPTAGKSFSGKFLVRVSPELHQKAVVQAFARNESLNQFVAGAIAKA